ncbi:MAG: tail fiber protein [Planctomycetota bacterium]
MDARWNRVLLAVALSLACYSAVPSAQAAVFTTSTTGSTQAHENYQPGLGVNYIMATQGTFPSRNSRGEVPLSGEPFLGEITMFAGNFAPRGWSFLDGQTLPIAQNQALFSLLGTTYGGDGRTNFRLPDMRGRTAIHYGSGPGLSNRTLGTQVGSDDVNLTLSQIPSHNHPLLGSPPDKITLDAPNTNNSGGNLAHTNMGPSLAINYYMPLTGTFPSRLDAQPNAGSENFLGSVRMAGFNFAPRNTVKADGQLLPIN